MEQLDREINRWSITFKQKNVEESFLASRRMGLLRASFWSCVVLTLLLLVNSVYLVLSFMNGDLQVSGLRTVLIHRTSCTGASLICCFTIVLCTCRSSACCGLHVRRLEQMASASACILMIAVQHMDWHYTGKLYGIPDVRFMDDDQLCYFYSSDTRMMLSWIALLTSSHFFMNIRWFMLLPCEIAGVLSYVFCAVLGSPEGIFNVPMNLALFSGITLLACTAKRQLERHERYSMLQLINERVRRFESDFKLEQAQSMSTSSPTSRLPADLQSVVTDQTGQTGFTQLIFDVKSNCRDQLRDMIKLGMQEHWLIEANQLHFNPEKLIGRGNYGVILHGKLLGMPVAVKLPLANASLSLPDLANELRFLRRVRHPHIVAFQGACILPEAEMLFLVEEVVKGTSLQDLLPKKLELSAKEKHNVLLGVCRALRYLHGLRPSIAHGDLKPTNVLVLQRDKTPKLIDFGLSRIRANNSRQLGGTPRYMAPEVLTKTAQMSQADKADVFSLGRVIFFTLTESNPLHGLSVQDVVSEAERHAVPPLQWPSSLPFHEKAPKLAAECLKPVPAERPNAAQVEKVLRSWMPSPNLSPAEADEEDADGDPELRLVNCCAAAARLYLMQKNQI
mmetsp:Transcript_11128/g.24464  ORF Transcript_11128/g.24464 Transcript_11128/m.24464 type:complete len:620 (-) Transcript_11128:25-1884(-)